MLRYQLKTTNAARIPTVAAFGSATITGNDMEDFRKMVSGVPKRVRARPWPI